MFAHKHKVACLLSCSVVTGGFQTCSYHTQLPPTRHSSQRQTINKHFYWSDGGFKKCDSPFLFCRSDLDFFQLLSLFPFFLFFSLSLSPSPSPGLLRAETPGAPPLKNNQLPTIQFLLFHSITVYVGSFMTLDVSTALVCFVIDFGFSSRRQIFSFVPASESYFFTGFLQIISSVQL